MKVSAQYAQEHFDELLATAQRGEEVEIASEGKQTFKLLVMPSSPSRTPVFGAGRGEIVLPTTEELKAMDQELEDLMLNGALFPDERA